MTHAGFYISYSGNPSDGQDLTLLRERIPLTSERTETKQSSGFTDLSQVTHAYLNYGPKSSVALLHYTATWKQFEVSGLTGLRARLWSPPIGLIRVYSTPVLCFIYRRQIETQLSLDHSPSTARRPPGGLVSLSSATGVSISHVLRSPDSSVAPRVESQASVPHAAPDVTDQTLLNTRRGSRATSPYLIRMSLHLCTHATLKMDTMWCVAPTIRSNAPTSRSRRRQPARDSPPAQARTIRWPASESPIHSAELPRITTTDHFSQRASCHSLVYYGHRIDKGIHCTDTLLLELEGRFGSTCLDVSQESVSNVRRRHPGDGQTGPSVRSLDGGFSDGRVMAGVERIPTPCLLPRSLHHLLV
ncbi:hypothetical protein C8Q80DRAFT_1135131 [Daedaleopsis nitida]|nr:hypothetical protein C8Q80DRAFT_1135131 [Daedaleopsis nitida]